jgi:hypothetical protein
LPADWAASVWNRTPRSGLDRLDHPDLNVSVHGAGEDGARLYCATEAVEDDPRGAVDGPVGHLSAGPFEQAAWVEDGRMLDRARLGLDIACADES